MVQCPTSQSNSNSAHPRIPRVLRNPNVHYRDQNSAPLVLIFSKINPLHTLPAHVLISISVSYYLCLVIRSGLHRWRVFNQNHKHVSSSPWHTSIIPDVMILIISGEKYKLLCSSLCPFSAASHYFLCLETPNIIHHTTKETEIKLPENGSNITELNKDSHQVK